jgi:hypothetical protein
MPVLNAVFWGLVLILIGTGVILNLVFHAQFPVWRFILGLVVVFWGLSVLVSSFFPRHWSRPGPGTVFSESRVDGRKTGNKFDTVFGRSEIDLTGVTLQDLPVSKKIDTVFGEAVISIDPSLPVEVSVNSVFGQVVLPDGNTVSGGNYSYRSPSAEGADKLLKIAIDCVFGKVVVKSAK